MTSMKETEEACEALIRWFESQEIKPSDAVSIMIRLMAMQLTIGTKDLDKLEDAVKATRNMLVLDIGDYLKNG